MQNQRSMIERRAVWIALAGVLAAGCAAEMDGAAGVPDGSPDSADAPPVRLVVLVVVDQLPAWSFERDRAAMSGGVDRLLDRGVYFAAGEYPYASTLTAPGHATLSTGTAPRQHGIIANMWYERESDLVVDAGADDAHPLLAVRADAVPGPGRSSHRLLAPGIADALAAGTEGAGRAVTVSYKDRSAIFMAGQTGALALWLDASQPGMTTSDFYAPALPGWLSDLEDREPLAARLEEVWEPRDPALLAELTGNVDEGPGEGPSDGGLGTHFPHAPATAANPWIAFGATPGANDLVFDVAEAAVIGEGLGADATPDFLGISLSAHDGAGHAWGQESWERLDLYLRLDRRLGEFLDFLDTTVGPEGYAVVLTSDHGATPLVEQSQLAGRQAWRINKADIVAAADLAATQVLGPGPWAAAHEGNTLFMKPAFFARTAAEQTAARDAMVAALAALPGMGLVASVEELSGPCDAVADAQRPACETIAPGRSGQIFAAATGDSLIAYSPTGTNHGAPTDWDRLVPVIVAAPGTSPRREDDRTSMLRVAPTLTSLLGVPPPALAAERPLDR